MVSTVLCSKRRTLAIILAAILVTLVVIILALTLFNQNSLDEEYTKIAIAVDVPPCAEFGLEVAKEGGSAMDVTIATLICAGLASPTSMGLGGGFLMTIVHGGKSFVLDARETAPAAATEDMFHGNATLATSGGLSIAVPSEIIGYWEAHKKFGNMSWEQLMNKAAKLCEDGVELTSYVARSLHRGDNVAAIKESPTLQDIFINPKTGKILEAGDMMKRPKLAETLRIIAKEGGWAVHNGSLTQRFYEDLQNFGSIITKEDLANYTVKWRDPVTATLPGNYTLLSVPPPGSGSLLSLVLQTVAGWVTSLDNDLDVHRVTEALKFMYARRTEIGDPFGNQSFVDHVNQLTKEMSNGEMAAKIRANISDTQTSNDTAAYGAHWAPTESHGTLHLAVATPDTAITVTSTINTLLGSKLRSRSTGIILNNEMDDFSLPGVDSYYGVPPSPANYIVPGKRPLSSMVPSIILNPDKSVRLIVGGSGGTKITTSTALIILNNLYFNKSLRSAIEAPRFHHQLLPMYAMTEEAFPNELLVGLRKRGHVTGPFTFPGSSVLGISVSDNRFTPVGDKRRGGVVAGL